MNRVSHQFQSSVGGCYSFFYVHMFNWVSSFLDWINYANKCIYISPWMIAWPALTPKCRRGGDSKVQWCQSLLITEVPHCMSENEYKLSHFSKSHYGAYFPVNYSSQVPFLQRENWWNLLTYRPIPKSTPRSLCDHSVMHFLLLIGLNYSPSWQ